VQEVIVTGQRASLRGRVVDRVSAQDIGAFPNSGETPHVVVNKRADNLLVEIRVVCDTRDRGQRLNELRATLHNMVRAAAGDHTVALAQGEEIVGAFDETMIEAVIRPDSKEDTSAATLLLKTPVSANDTFDQASKRIRSFIAKVDKVGRSEVLIN